MSLAKYIADLMLTCPHITIKPKDMHIDNAAKAPTNYSIESEPINAIAKKYLNGDAIKQYTWALIARKQTFDDGDRSANAKTFEDVSRWFEDLTRQHIIPPMTDGRRPMKLEALDSVYLLERAEDNDTGLYAMQCRLTYYERARYA